MQTRMREGVARPTLEAEGCAHRLARVRTRLRCHLRCAALQDLREVATSARFEPTPCSRAGSRWACALQPTARFAALRSWRMECIRRRSAPVCSACSVAARSRRPPVEAALTSRSRCRSLLKRERSDENCWQSHDGAFGSRDARRSGLLDRRLHAEVHGRKRLGRLPRSTRGRRVGARFVYGRRCGSGRPTRSCGRDRTRHRAA